MKAAALRAQIENSLGPKFDANFTLREKARPELLSSGIPALDIPRGTLTEIYGPASSGRTSILIGALARATQRPEFCALVDAGNSFDPQAATGAGVHLPHLLWVRCSGNAEHALKAADLLVQAGGFGIVALDLAGLAARDARRISLASWFRLRHAVEKTSTALIVLEEEVNARSCSALQIENRPAGFHMQGKLLRGLHVDSTLGPRNCAKSTFTLKPLYRE